MELNPETLERLLIDRSLGELSRDADELLKAYTTIAGGDLQARGELDELVATARQALEPRHFGDPPLLKAPAIKRRRFGSWTAAAAMVASIIFAFWLGRQMDAGTPVTPMVKAATAPQVSNSFWSQSRYELNANAPSAASRVQWKSPLAWPRTGEDL